MLEKEMWKFNKISMIEECSFNDQFKNFFKRGIDSLVRENIQNSLDGKVIGVDKPVEVIIHLDTMLAEQLPGYAEISSRVLMLNGSNNYDKDRIKHMKEKMNDRLIRFISFEDKNTKGLKGALHGSNIEKGDTYHIYAYQKGAHNIDENSDTENMRGGSHGVGKISSNAASDLHLMYFANCDEEGNKHLGGTVQLIEHEFQNNCYRSTGYFTDCISDNFIPYVNNFNKVFKKEERGLKIVIPFLREELNNEHKIIKAVCDNFFVSILENRLIVRVNDTSINKETIVEIFKNNENEENSDPLKNFTSLYLDTYSNFEPEIIKIMDSNTEYNFNLYFQYNNERIKRGRTAIVRSIGMKIEDFKVTNYSKTPYNAILIPESSIGDKFLKSLENESHTEISANHINNIETKKSAKKFINNLQKKLTEYIAFKIKELNGDDDHIDTKDLIYSVETSFKKILSDKMTSVEISKGEFSAKKSIIKINKNKYEKRDNAEDNNEQKNGDNKRANKRDNKNGNKQKDVEQTSFALLPESVKRVMLNDKEFIMLDISKQKNYDNENKCNIKLKLVDGTGKVLDGQFKIEEVYSSVFDSNANKFINVSSEKMNGISIHSGIISIELKLKIDSNYKLKFIYVVEVYDDLR